MIDKFVAEASGDASLSTKELRRTVPFTESAMPQVVSKLQDRDAPIPEIMRLVLGEIAAVALEISASPLDAEGNRYRSLCQARIRCLQALQKSLLEQAKGSKDELDFDGPKMKFVIAAWVRWVKQALREGLGKGTDVQQQTVLRIFRDIASTEEQELRKATAKIGRNDGANDRNPWDRAVEP
jgi:hypothetical protein